jgi:hypothetical protein
VRSSEARDVFELSIRSNTLYNMNGPATQSLSVLSENELKHHMIPQRFSEVRVEFDLSASNNLTPPSVQILFSVLVRMK